MKCKFVKKKLDKVEFLVGFRVVDVSKTVTLSYLSVT